MLKPFACAAVSAVLLVASPGRSRGDDGRYTGEFSNGKRIENAQLTDWGNDNFPRLNGQALFDQASPIRWLRRDTTEQSTIPQAFIEMVGGDVLPGRVMGLGPTATLPEGEIGANLLVEPAIPLNAPDASPRSVVRVLTRWLRRVVWQRRSIDPYQPGTLFLRDGRQLAFKAVRFENRGVSVLTDTDRRVVPYNELAELDLPRIDGWEAYFEQLALLTPDCGLRLMRVETLDGLRATTSSERFRPTFFGDAANPDHWYHALQPAWSLDPLFVRHRTVNMRWFYGPHELPLSLVEASQVNLRSALAVGWRPQRDRNVQGGPLDSGGKQYGWGLGMQAYTEMSFPLPACAEAFQSLVGLDRVVGTGGCAGDCVCRLGVRHAAVPQQSSDRFLEGRRYGPLETFSGRRRPFAIGPRGAPGPCRSSAGSRPVGHSRRGRLARAATFLESRTTAHGSAQPGDPTSAGP